MEKEASRTAGTGFSRSVMRFGPYELDLRSAELRKAGVKIRLQTQPFQVLVALLERPGEVVLRDELRKKLWPDDTVVEFDHSINAAIKRLRDVLHESADKPRYIETLARRGYRFIGDVPEPSTVGPEQTVADLPASEASPFITATPDVASSEPDDISRVPVRIRQLRLPVLAAIVVMVAVCGWYWNYRSNARIRWAREVALPEAIRLIEAGKNARAFSFILRAEQVIPNDPTLSRIRRQISHPITIRTNPAGATIWAKAYEEPDGEWLPIGTSPIENFLLPLGYFRWKLVKTGFRTVEGPLDFKLPISISL